MRTPTILGICLMALVAGVVAARPGPAAATPLTTSIGAGNSYTCAVTTSGILQCWGFNSLGELGNGLKSGFEARPVRVVGLGDAVSSVSAGMWHTCAVTVAGGVKCWGSNSNGTLGDGTRTDSLAPVDVVGLGGAVSEVVATRGLYTCALTIVGSMQCWGNNNIGQLGDDATCGLACETPVQVVGMGSGVTDIAAGESHTCALRSGAVWCWGGNNLGAVGDGTTEERATPTAVVGLNGGVTDLGSGDWHMCAVIVGGVQCWGVNQFGQLGDGTAGDGELLNMEPFSTAPVDVVGLGTSIVAVDGGMGHTCALTTSASVQCWGWNRYGQLGDGTKVDSPVPVDVVGLDEDVIAIAAGGFHTCALMGSGSVKCWGGAALLGIGEPSGNDGPSSPVDVLFDSDDDGCADAQEQGSDVTLGGLRNPKSFWDFFDVWTGSPFERDRAVNIGDIGAVVARFGASREPAPTVEEALAEALTAPADASSYHASFDRGGSDPGGSEWDLLPPDGVVGIGDIGAVVAQFGHSCA